MFVSSFIAKCQRKRRATEKEPIYITLNYALHAGFYCHWCTAHTRACRCQTLFIIVRFMHSHRQHGTAFFSSICAFNISVLFIYFFFYVYVCVLLVLMLPSICTSLSAHFSLWICNRLSERSLCFWALVRCVVFISVCARSVRSLCVHTNLLDSNNWTVSSDALYGSFNACVRKLVWVRSRTCQLDLEMWGCFIVVAVAVAVAVIIHSFVSPLPYHALFRRHTHNLSLSHSPRVVVVCCYFAFSTTASTMFRLYQLVKCIDHVR